MPRPHIEFLFAQAIGWSASPLPGREEGRAKLLSRDETAGELSVILRLAPGWSGRVEPMAQEEIYVLDGDLAIDGVGIERDGYARLAAGRETEWRTQGGMAALVFLNAPSPADAADPVVIDTVAMPWDRSGVPAELDYMGIARKPLFVDPDSGRHRTWLLSVPPQIAPTGAMLAVETHGCAEEVFMLSGDITGPYGAMTPGAYFWRPAETFHGPFGSRNGGLALSRFRHGPQTTIFHPERLPFRFDAPYRPMLPAALAALAEAAPEPSARY